MGLDRSILTVREAPKPYFEVDGGELVSKGVPIDSDTERWFAEHPPAIGSYLVALTRRRWRVLGRRETEIAHRRSRAAAAR